MVDGATYVRSKSGNILKKDLRDRNSKYRGNCPYFTKTGTCSRGASCKYAKHDKDHVALCKHFSLGSCSKSACPLSHVPSPFNSPTCTYFLIDKCSNDNCKFLHVKPKTDTICADFSSNGSCENGDACEYLHSFDCPDFYNSGHCERPGCRLKHRERPKGRQFDVSAKEEGTVNTLKLANSLFDQPEESDSDADLSSDESSIEYIDEEDGDEKMQEDLDNDFIKI